jgi:hypothetical protein
MNLPLQREPVERSLASQAATDKDPAAAMLASGVSPSGSGIQPDAWQDIVGKLLQTGLSFF